MILYKKLGQLRDKYGVSWDLLEQDYLLSWMLAGIAATPELRDMLIFKGGTALKKSYFGEYRFSQDLDFTTISPLPDDQVLSELIAGACVKAMNLQSAHNELVSITWQLYTEKKPHPHNQKAFVVLGQFPWHGEPLTRIMVEGLGTFSCTRLL